MINMKTGVKEFKEAVLTGVVPEDYPSTYTDYLSIFGIEDIYECSKDLINMFVVFSIKEIQYQNAIKNTFNCIDNRLSNKPFIKEICSKFFEQLKYQINDKRISGKTMQFSTIIKYDIVSLDPEIKDLINDFKQLWFVKDAIPYYENGKIHYVMVICEANFSGESKFINANFINKIDTFELRRNISKDITDYLTTRLLESFIVEGSTNYMIREILVIISKDLLKDRTDTVHIMQKEDDIIIFQIYDSILVNLKIPQIDFSKIYDTMENIMSPINSISKMTISCRGIRHTELYDKSNIEFMAQIECDVTKYTTQ